MTEMYQYEHDQVLSVKNFSKIENKIGGYLFEMSVVNKLIVLILIKNMYCANDLKELHYRGISITWRRLVPLRSDEIRLEMIITMALSDKSISICDSHHPKSHIISPDFGLECIESWDKCLSWPLKTLPVQCQSKSHGDLLKTIVVKNIFGVFLEYPKSVVFDEIALSLPAGTVSNDVYYKIEFPPRNVSCCWESFDWSEKSIRLLTFLNLLSLSEINSPPIARFPEHIYIGLNKPFVHSLEVFDPDGDPFQCSLSSPISFLTFSDNCQLTSKSSSSKIEYINVIEIEIIEYSNEKKDQIRSRLPYHLIAFVDSLHSVDTCVKLPSVKLLNIENIQIHVSLNEIVLIHLISSSECSIGMDECLINSPFHWKIKSHIEKSIENDRNEVEYIFEWIPKLNEQCGFQIHCIRCLDQFGNSNDKCIQIFVDGPTCRIKHSSSKFSHLIYFFFSEIEHQIKDKCTWSPFSIWLKFNQTFYKRNRICSYTSDHTKACSFCLGSSLELQSSLAFLKGFSRSFFFIVLQLN